MRPASLTFWIGMSIVCTACNSKPSQPQSADWPIVDGAFQVHEGRSIQAAIDLAAKHRQIKRVQVHAGVYRPPHPGQALLRFNAEHDGLMVEAVGQVTLTATNADLADPEAATFPSVVNHVVYFGDGITERTVFRGFRITGAGGYIHPWPSMDPLEPKLNTPRLEENVMFYYDGGAVKVFGRSSPRLESLTIEDNFAALCGGGISIEQRGFDAQPVLIRDCVFSRNRCPGTGAALDVLTGSAVVVDNCLFVHNISNTGMDQIEERWGLRHNPEHGSGALTVFPEARAEVTRCTFAHNWNGTSDQGTGSRYVDCIFWMNTASDGSRPRGPYEMDVAEGTLIEGCFLQGDIEDLSGVIDPARNELDAPDPQWDDDYRPSRSEYNGVGYRPTATASIPKNADEPTR